MIRLRRGAIRAGMLAALLLAALPALRAPARAQPAGEIAGVVSLKVTSQAYDALLPWNKDAEESQVGNAMVVAGPRLVTTADLVKNANLLQVRKFGRYPDYPARAVRVDYDLNLALLEVDDAEFWEGLHPLPIATRPVPSGRFEINRWRANGRFEQGTGEMVEFVVSTSPFGVMEFPLLRGTTAMSGLGWSEVLTANGQVIGLLVSHSEQRIQAVNSDLLNLLVQAAGMDPYPDFAHRGFAWQPLNQPALREYFGLGRQDTGVLVRRLFPGGTGSRELQPWDILHRINGYGIDPEGHIDHPSYGPLQFTMAINESLAPTVPVEVQRDGKTLKLELRRSRFPPDAYRIPPPVLDRPNDYVVFGGLVLQELQLGYLRAWGRDWRTKAPGRLVIEYSLRSLREGGQEPGKVLIISRVLSDPANLGFEDVSNGIVVSANERPLASLDDFREALRHPVRGYHLLRILPGEGREQLVFQADRLPEIDRRVAERYGIPARKP